MARVGGGFRPMPGDRCWRAATAGDRRMGERRGLLIDGADNVRCGGGELRVGFRAGRPVARGGVDAGGG
jgi:hypothetical protein